MVERAPAEQSNDGAAERLSAEDVLPRQFGKYTLLRRLAAGGMAELFLALHRSVAGFEKLIVVKRIHPSMNSDGAFIEMLLHEARIAATLSHPNIVQIFDVGQIDGKYFIAMEHIHGEDIRSILRAMRKHNILDFPLEHSLSIVVGICAGLAYAHEKRNLDGALLNIVHRDISPQNILVTFTGDVKIVDFGIAKSTAYMGEETRDGQLKGKIPYMSPEQASGELVDSRTDIFATGIILFELTTGKRLFKGTSEFETLKLICDKEYPRPSQVCRGYSTALERIVMKALAKNREDRYQSAREMQSDLEKVIREERIPVSQVSLTHWMQSLFEDKLNQQKEVLQDIKQMADVLAAQAAPDGTARGGTMTDGMGLASRVSAAPPRRRSARRWIALGVLAAAAAGGAVYAMKAQKEDPSKETPAEPAPAPPVSAPPPVEQAKGWLDVSSEPAGCAIWINGDLQKEITPARIDNLPIDREITVKLTKEGLEPHLASVTLSAAEPSRKISANLQTGSVTVLLKVEPPPTIWLDGEIYKGDPAKIEKLSAGEEHKIVLAANGYAPKTVTFIAQRGETKVIEEKLRRLDPADARPAPSDAAPAEPRPAPNVAAPSDAEAKGTAKVRIGAKGGFCNVTVNGVQVGPTPVETPVNPGTVKITCKPEGGPGQSQSIRVGAGETARVSFKLD